MTLHDYLRTMSSALGEQTVHLAVKGTRPKSPKTKEMHFPRKYSTLGYLLPCLSPFRDKHFQIQPCHFVKQRPCSAGKSGNSETNTSVAGGSSEHRMASRMGTKQGGVSGKGGKIRQSQQERTRGLWPERVNYSTDLAGQPFRGVILS